MPGIAVGRAPAPRVGPLAGRNPLHDQRSGAQRLREQPQPDAPPPVTWWRRALAHLVDFARSNALFVALMLAVLVVTVGALFRLRPTFACGVDEDGNPTDSLSVFGMLKVVTVALCAYVLIWFVLKPAAAAKSAPVDHDHDYDRGAAQPPYAQAQAYASGGVAAQSQRPTSAAFAAPPPAYGGGAYGEHGGYGGYGGDDRQFAFEAQAARPPTPRYM